MMNLSPILPEIILLCLTCLTLIVDLFIKQRRGYATYAFAQLSLLVTLAIVLMARRDPVTLLFHGTFVWDPVAYILKVAILVVSFFAFIYSRNYIEERQIQRGEYYTLSLFSVLGMLVLVSAHSMLTIFMGLELVSLPLYALVAIHRDEAVGAEAAMKYFVMGALASAMLLYGMSMLFGAAHTFELAPLAQAISVTPADHQMIYIFGLVFVIAGAAFKLGAVPFHMWVPDVYEGAPTSVTLFVGSAPKVAALGMTVRLLVDGMPGLFVHWQEILTVFAVLSIALGNVVAIVQSNLKRMLSYSAIAHIGYTLLGLIAGTTTGYASATFYIIAYALMSLGGFAMLALMSKAGFEAENINDLRGLNARSPWLAFMMLLIMFSMAGIPPLVGFFAKLGVLEALITVHKVWLATYALVFAVIGAYYYLNVVKVMYFEEPIEVTTPVTAPFDMRLAVTVNCLGVLLLGMFPSGLIDFCRTAYLHLG